MPIYGVTDNGQKLHSIGAIHKGAAKVKGIEQPGADLKWFRVVFNETEQESADLFKQVYGNEPTRINVVLPFDDIDLVSSFFLECYDGTGRLIARSDNRIYLWKTDYKSGEILVRGGLDKNNNPMPYDPNKPEYNYVARNGKVVSVFCKAYTRIEVIISDLNRLATLTVLSTSTYDAANLSQQLQALNEISGGNLSRMPMILQRSPKKVSCPNQDGTRSLREKWLLSIEPDPVWVRTRRIAMRTQSYMLGEGLEGKELTPDLASGDPDGEVEPAPVAEVQQNPQPGEISQAEKTTQIGKDVLRDLELQTAALHQELHEHIRKPAISQAYAQSLYAFLQDLIQDLPLTQKLYQTLTGLQPGDPPNANTSALFHWLKVYRDSGGAYLCSNREAADKLLKFSDLLAENEVPLPAEAEVFGPDGNE